MTTQAHRRQASEDYLRAERQAKEKSEYHDGEVLAMAGASYAHNVIVANVVAALHRQLRGKSCTVLPSDIRVWIASAQRYVYPDVTVVCGEPEFTDAEQDTLVNPTLLIEVLSKATRDYDRGDKFERYRTLDTFAEYVLLAQSRIHCEHYLRQPKGSWLLTEEHRLDTTLVLPSISCELALTEVYDKVKLVGLRAV